MNTELADIIHLNNINEEVLYNAVHKDILESVLSEICEYMKENDSSYISIKKIYYRSADDIEAIRQIVRNICHLSLPKNDLEWLNNCVKAFMKKKTHRKQFSNALRQELWNKQGRKCRICGKEILVEDGHIDHVVPWDYVGDELDNNYQVLCTDCNLHKSNHVALAVHLLIFNKI